MLRFRLGQKHLFHSSFYRGQKIRRNLDTDQLINQQVHSGQSNVRMETDWSGVFGEVMKEGSVLDKIMVRNSTTNHSTDSSKNELT